MVSPTRGWVVGWFAEEVELGVCGDRRKERYGYG
jgi:hypothetical protein